MGFNNFCGPNRDPPSGAHGIGYQRRGKLVWVDSAANWTLCEIQKFSGWLIKAFLYRATIARFLISSSITHAAAIYPAR